MRSTETCALNSSPCEGRSIGSIDCQTFQMTDAKKKDEKKLERGNLPDAFVDDSWVGRMRVSSRGALAAGFPFPTGSFARNAPRLSSGPRTARAPRTRWSARSACLPSSPRAECSWGGSTCLRLAVLVLCQQSGRCVGHVEATAARGGVCLGRSARDGGGGREEQTVGAFERVRGASSRAPEPGPGRSRPRKRASAPRETLVSD